MSRSRRWAQQIFRWLISHGISHKKFRIFITPSALKSRRKWKNSYFQFEQNENYSNCCGLVLWMWRFFAIFLKNFEHFWRQTQNDISHHGSSCPDSYVSIIHIYSGCIYVCVCVGKDKSDSRGCGKPHKSPLTYIHSFSCGLYVRGVPPSWNTSETVVLEVTRRG